MEHVSKFWFLDITDAVLLKGKVLTDLCLALRVKKQEKEKGISAAIESTDKDEKKKKKK